MISPSAPVVAISLCIRGGVSKATYPRKFARSVEGIGLKIYDASFSVRIMAIQGCKAAVRGKVPQELEHPACHRAQERSDEWVCNDMRQRWVNVTICFSKSQPVAEMLRSRKKVRGVCQRLA